MRTVTFHASRCILFASWVHVNFCTRWETPYGLINPAGLWAALPDLLPWAMHYRDNHNMMSSSLLPSPFSYALSGQPHRAGKQKSSEESAVKSHWDNHDRRQRKEWARHFERLLVSFTIYGRRGARVYSPLIKSSCFQASSFSYHSSGIVLKSASGTATARLGNAAATTCRILSFTVLMMRYTGL